MPTDLARALYRVSDAVRADADPPFDWPRVTLSKNIDDTAGASSAAGVNLASLRGTFRGNRVAPEGGHGGEGAKGAAPPSGRGVRRVLVGVSVRQTKGLFFNRESAAGGVSIFLRLIGEPLSVTTTHPRRSRCPARSTRPARRSTT
jgi:hypothetical protein